MTTPTREQVIEQAIQGHAGTRMAMQWLFDQAHTAGRDQGLREAKELCERTAAEGMRFTGTREQGARSCAAAIKQLRGK